MWRQRIYFRNTGHRCCKRRSYRSSGTYQISILIGFPHQFLRNDIHNRITVGNNRVKFFIQSVFYNLRKYFSIHLMCFIKTDILQILIRVFNDRRIFIRMNW